MSYYRDDGCLATLVTLPLIAAWHILKFALIICVNMLLIPVRFIWLLITIPISIFTGKDFTDDLTDLFFPND